MWLISILILHVAAASLLDLPDTEASIPKRHKRNALQLCHMINVYAPLHCGSYAAYGCFCGIRSWGNNPVDASDRCCRQHDQCFAGVGCRNLRWLSYSYHCTDTTCQCTDRNRDSCQYRSCVCDVQLAECLRTASWNPVYLLYNQRNCR